MRRAYPRCHGKAGRLDGGHGEGLLSRCLRRAWAREREREGGAPDGPSRFLLAPYGFARGRCVE